MSVLKAAWETILEFDYEPVFAPALGVLQALPDTTAMKNVVRGLAERFHIERVITSHDPKRPNFSENTGIHESLMICRRRTDDVDLPTEFFSLGKMPKDASEAIACADDIGGGGGQLFLGHPPSLAERESAAGQLVTSAMV